MGKMINLCAIRLNCLIFVFRFFQIKNTAAFLNVEPCSEGTWGNPCFLEKALPSLLLFAGIIPQAKRQLQER